MFGDAVAEAAFGTWSVNGNILTVHVSQSTLSQRVGFSESVQVQPVSRNECRVTGAQATFVMQRVQ